MTATKETVLGGLVHRALTMPFAKPAPPQQFAQVPASAEQLVQAFRLRLDSDKWACVDGARDWSRAVCLVDSGGPYWSRLVDDFFALGAGRYESLSTVQEAVLDRVVPASAALADGVAGVAARRGWQQVCGEMQLAQACDFGFSITRPDLVGVLGPTAAVVDAKVTAWSPTGWVEAQGHDSNVLEQFARWEERLRLIGYEEVSWWLAIVQVDWATPVPQNRSMWRFDVDEETWVSAGPRRRRRRGDGDTARPARHLHGDSR